MFVVVLATLEMTDILMVTLQWDLLTSEVLNHLHLRDGETPCCLSIFVNFQEEVGGCETPALAPVSGCVRRETAGRMWWEGNGGQQTPLAPLSGW